MAQRPLMPFSGARSAMRRREELDPMWAFRRDMDRLFDDFLSGFGLPTLGGELSRDSRSMAATPRIDVSETDQELRVVAEMPGLDQDSIEVSLDDDILTLRGQRQDERKDDDEARNYHLRERMQSSFARSLALPFRPDPRQVQAMFKDGVLTITIAKPKDAQEKAHRIEVKRDGASGIAFDRAAAGDKPSAATEAGKGAAAATPDQAAQATAEQPSA